MADQFTWIDIYQELADVLRASQDKKGKSFVEIIAGVIETLG